MVVLIEFLDREPIENYITCLNYQVDRVVFFGYQKEIDRQRETAQNFLKKECGISSVIFHAVSATNAKATIENITKQVEAEKGHGADVFFDVTGGESLILTAFGIIAERIKAPVHFFDVVKGEIHEIETGANKHMSTFVPERKVRMTIDRYLCMYGGIEIKERHKNNKELTQENIVNLRSLCEVSEQFREVWNGFSNFMAYVFNNGDSLSAARSAQEVILELNKDNVKIGTVKDLNEILDTLSEKKLITDLVHEDGKYRLKYVNKYVKACILEAGSVLELNACSRECIDTDEYRIGVNIDWDGVVHPAAQGDVYNEIDVLTLKGYILTFISCKSGKFRNDEEVNRALYELETVATRFGGRYAVKKIYLKNKLGPVHEERAEEMGIRLIYV
ncbi:MAG: DUF1887 family protein [Lachnospiraceae bacterium]|nr:DUF1887 family protein [Lachnospiraceae bacterium]